MDGILGPKVNKDEEDFGPGAHIVPINVGSAVEWASLVGGGGTIDINSTTENYIINITNDFETSVYLSLTGFTGTISIRGNHTITYSGGLYGLLSIYQTVVLRSPLKGKSTNTGPVVFVAAGGNFIMRDGASITDNNCTGFGSAVQVNGGSFTMHGGTISGNTATSNDGSGVYITSGTFTLYGGTISGNTSAYNGGGVFVNPSIANRFTMHGGTIKGNRANTQGGGVYVALGGTFIKTGGIIYGNDAGGNSNYATLGGHAAIGVSAIDYTLKPRVSGCVEWP
jgi:parallel beta-helix repeat protein